MGANLLVDTGAIVALLDRDDRWHQLCLDTFRQLRLPALTSEAVLTEVFHLIKRTSTDLEKVWKFLNQGAARIAPIENWELQQIEALMWKYQDCEMDFADATLVYLAERESISVVFTIDQGDFATYRIGAKGRFQIVPVGQP